MNYMNWIFRVFRILHVLHTPVIKNHLSAQISAGAYLLLKIILKDFNPYFKLYENSNDLPESSVDFQ